jgi:hypothetical protein
VGAPDREVAATLRAMRGQTRSERQVLRNRAVLKRLPLLVGILVVLGLLQGDDRGGALLFWVMAAVIVPLACLPSLTIAPEGLIVVNLLPRRYLWDDIAEVEEHWGFYGPGLRLRLRDGSRKKVWAVMPGKGAWGAQWIDQTIEQVRTRWERETATSAR